MAYAKIHETSGAETFTTGLLVFLGIESMSAVRGYIEDMTVQNYLPL
jgi:hypothetical protein